MFSRLPTSRFQSPATTSLQVDCPRRLKGGGYANSPRRLTELPLTCLLPEHAVYHQIIPLLFLNPDSADELIPPLYPQNLFHPPFLAEPILGFL